MITPVEVETKGDLQKNKIFTRTNLIEIYIYHYVTVLLQNESIRRRKVNIEDMKKDL